MRLQSLTMRNFRQYKKVDMAFPKSKQDLHILKGDNGVGKTTFLNAINWCLYGDEPHAFDQDTAADVLNVTANADDEVRVSISVIADNGVEFIFTRTKQNNKMNFAVDVKSKSGESKHVKGDEALNLVDDFVPIVIREFFFFDGEQLDSYFLNNKGKHIKHNVFILSHIDILENMHSHLDTKFKRIRKQASNLDSDVDDINKNLEKKENALKEEEKREQSVNDNITESLKKIAKLTEELEGIPDIRELEKQKQDLESEIQKCEDKLEQIDVDRSELIVSSAPALFTHDAMKSLYDAIVEKENNKELPYQVDEEVIQESLDEGTCKVCNRHLDDSSKTFLRNSLAAYQLSTDQSKLLLDLKPTLKVSMNILNSYPNSSKMLSKHYKDINDDLIENQEKWKKVMEDYVGYNENNEEIINKFNLREELKASKDGDHILLGKIKTNMENLKDEIKDLNDDLAEAMKNNQKLKILNKKKELCETARDLANDTKNEIMNRTKDDIEEFTRSAFFDLIWKKETYETVNIDDSYQLQLINKRTKKNTLGTASAAERELLTLSFTLGIHSISGFDAPLLIDTPLARTSGDNRVNFVEKLLEVSTVKQIIIIVTPDEYSPNVAPILDNVRNKFEITMNDAETISTITPIPLGSSDNKKINDAETISEIKEMK